MAKHSFYLVVFLIVSLLGEILLLAPAQAQPAATFNSERLGMDAVLSIFEKSDLSQADPLLDDPVLQNILVTKSQVDERAIQNLKMDIISSYRANTRAKKTARLSDSKEWAVKP